MLTFNMLPQIRLIFIFRITKITLLLFPLMLLWFNIVALWLHRWQAYLIPSCTFLWWIFNCLEFFAWYSNCVTFWVPPTNFPSWGSGGDQKRVFHCPLASGDWQVVKLSVAKFSLDTWICPNLKWLLGYPPPISHPEGGSKKWLSTASRPLKILI